MAANQGINSLQYTCVRENIANIAGYLQHNPAAKVALVRQLQSKGWLTTGVEVGPDALVSLVLQRISLDPNEYDSFVAMLEEVVGTDIIVKTLRGTMYMYVLYMLEVHCSPMML